MKARSTQTYIVTGTWIWHLTNVQKGSLIYTNLGIGEGIALLLIKLQDCGFKVTSVIAEPLRVLVQSWSDEEEEQKSINPNFETWKSSQILSEDYAKKVNECARQIEKTINAESSTMMAFILESRK